MKKTHCADFNNILFQNTNKKSHDCISHCLDVTCSACVCVCLFRYNMKAQDRFQTRVYVNQSSSGSFSEHSAKNKPLWVTKLPKALKITQHSFFFAVLHITLWRKPTAKLWENHCDKILPSSIIWKGNLFTLQYFKYCNKGLKNNWYNTAVAIQYTSIMLAHPWLSIWDDLVMKRTVNCPVSLHNLYRETIFKGDKLYLYIENEALNS